MKNRDITITTKEHFNKYKNLCNGYKEQDLFNLVNCLYNNKEELQKKFNDDIHLNNINMKLIDSKFKEVMYFLKDKIRTKEDNKTFLVFSLAESCCFLKHILVYRVLKIKPYFEEDILNLKELYKIWFNLNYGVTKKHFNLDLWYLDNKDKWILKEDNCIIFKEIKE